MYPESLVKNNGEAKGGDRRQATKIAPLPPYPRRSTAQTTGETQPAPGTGNKPRGIPEIDIARRYLERG